MKNKIAFRLIIITITIILLTGITQLIPGLKLASFIDPQSVLAYYQRSAGRPVTVFGIEHSTFRECIHLQRLEESGTTWVRRESLKWSDVEVNQGVYTWSNVATLDQDLINASNAGLEVILVVRSTPQWAQLWDEDGGVYCGRIKADKLSAFGNFMNEAVDHYSQPPYNIKYWEIWNEPDADYAYLPNSPKSNFGCWGDESDTIGYGGDHFAEMLSYVYPRMKEYDEQAQVILGGLLLSCRPDFPGYPNNPCYLQANFLRGVLDWEEPGTEKTGKDFFDIVAFHAYDHYYNKYPYWYDNGAWDSQSDDEGPSLIVKYQYLRDLLNEYKAWDKELINTEGALLCVPRICSPDDPKFLKTKAYYVAEFFAASIAKGLPASIYHGLAWTFHNSALMTDNLDPTDAYVAFQTARNILGDATFVQGIEEIDGMPAGMKGYVFDRGGKIIWMLWSVGGPHTIPLNGATPQSAWDVLGEPVYIDPVGPSIDVDRTPIYIVWGGNNVYLPLVLK